MTVSTTTNRASYSGNGSTAAFAYGFKIFADADLTVIIRSSTGVETTKTLTTHYTVSGAGTDSGGNVTFTSGNIPASGETVVILRKLTLTQGTDYVANDPFPAESHEDALDRLTMITQQLDEAVGRSLKVSQTNVIATSEFTTSATDRANKLLSFDGSGDLTVTEGKIDTVTISASGLSTGATPTATATYTAASGALALALGIPAGATGATGATGGGGSLDNIVEDTSPELGGDLDVLARDIVSSSNRNIDLLPHGSGKVNLDGDGSSGGVTISDGLVDIRTGTGSRAQIKLYCESSNQHAQTIQPQPHSAAASNTLTLPAGGDGTLVSTNSQSTFLKAQVPSTYTAALSATSGVLDFDTYQNFIITLASGSNTLAAPTTEASQIGQTGAIILIQPSSGSAATLSLHGDYESPAAGGITLSSANNAYDVLPYIVKADNSILLGAAQLAFA